jgi:hypothetical protein
VLAQGPDHVVPTYAVVVGPVVLVARRRPVTARVLLPSIALGRRSTRDAAIPTPRRGSSASPTRSSQSRRERQGPRRPNVDGRPPARTPRRSRAHERRRRPRLRLSARRSSRRTRPAPRSYDSALVTQATSGGVRFADVAADWLEHADGVERHPVRYTGDDDTSPASGPGRRAAIGTPRGVRDARAKRHPGERALRPAHRPGAAARPRRGTVPHPDAKTEAGVREVQLSPDLVEELVSHFDRLRRAGQPTDAERVRVPEHARRAPVAPARRPRSSARRPSCVRAARRARAAAAAATRRRTRCGGRTSRSRCWPTASTCCGSWARSGHADSKMTMDVYAQLAAARQARARDGVRPARDEAREQLYGPSAARRGG